MLKRIVIVVGSAAVAWTLGAPSSQAQTAPVTCSWTDVPIVAGQTLLKAEHINEIRACLDAILANWPNGDPTPPGTDTWQESGTGA